MRLFIVNEEAGVVQVAEDKVAVLSDDSLGAAAQEVVEVVEGLDTHRAPTGDQGTGEAGEGGRGRGQTEREDAEDIVLAVPVESEEAVMLGKNFEMMIT